MTSPFFVDVVVRSIVSSIVRSSPHRRRANLFRMPIDHESGLVMTIVITIVMTSSSYAASSCPSFLLRLDNGELLALAEK